MTLSTLGTDKNLNETEGGGTPMDWFSVMYQKAKDLVLVTVSEISRLQEEVLMETDRNKTTSSDVSPGMMRGMRALVEEIRGDNKETNRKHGVKYVERREKGGHAIIGIKSSEDTHPGQRDESRGPGEPEDVKSLQESTTSSTLETGKEETRFYGLHKARSSNTW